MCKTRDQAADKNKNNNDLWSIADHSLNIFTSLKDGSEEKPRTELDQSILGTVNIVNIGQISSTDIFTRLREVFGFKRKQEDMSLVESSKVIERYIYLFLCIE